VAVSAFAKAMGFRTSFPTGQDLDGAMNITRRHSLCLHIGGEKTGSKSIQQYFSDRHRGLWQNHRVFYPVRSPLFLGSAHFPVLTAFLPRAKMEFLPSGVAVTAGQIGDELRSIARLLSDSSPDPHAILLSAEHFSSRLRGQDIHRLAAVLGEALPDYRIMVVYHVRSQDGLYCASLSTHLKGVGTEWRLPGAARQGWIYDHSAIAEGWAHAFGRDNVRIVNFHADNAIRAILAIVAPTAPALMVPSKYRNNRSLSWEQAQILHVVNNAFGPALAISDRMMRFRLNYNEMVMSYLDEAPVQRTALTDTLTEADRRMLRDHFGASNDALQRAFRTDFNLNTYLASEYGDRAGTHQVNEATNTELSLWRAIASHAPGPNEGEVAMMRYMDRQLRRMRQRAVTRPV
jgi:hypothetical protein